MSKHGKNFILTADDLGIEEAYDRAILEGFQSGFLTSACICTNTKSYDHAIKSILPKCSGLEIGIHLNISEGKSLTKCPLLTDKERNFNLGFASLLLKSYSKKALKEIEGEFRAQIEKFKADTTHPITFFNSHIHTHSIPNIFEITAKLAKEYNIKFVRIQAEKLYMTDKMPKPVNLIKVFILNYFSAQNIATLKKYGLCSNNYTLGIGFTGEMTDKTIYYGVKSLSHLKDASVECIIHPSDNTDSSRYEEFRASLNLELKAKIEELGFKIGGFKNLLKE